MTNVSYIVFPFATPLEQTQRFWSSKARLVNEGVTVASTPLKLRKNPPPNTELIIIAYNEWEQDPVIKKMVVWCQKNMCPVRVINPTSWRTISSTKWNAMLFPEKKAVRTVSNQKNENRCVFV